MKLLIETLYWLVPIFFAITIHEFSHGWVAYKLGDPTAKHAGRLTLNPIKHIDPIGFLLLLLVHFGWAKPVPINPLYFRNPRRDMFLVSLAGPLSNFLTAFVVAIIIRSPFFSFLGVVGGKILYILFILSLILMFFNLIPIPPLDGWQILKSSLKQGEWMYRFEAYGFLIIFVLLLLPYLMGIDPLMDYLNLTVSWGSKILLGSFYLHLGA